MLLPVFILVAVAINQPRLYHQDHITSWKGGGFGMFANIDKHSWRPVVITLTTSDRNGENKTTMQVDIRSYLSLMQKDVDLYQHFNDTAALPSQHNLAELASQIASVKFIMDEGPYAIANDQGFGTIISARQVKIEIYRMIYDDPTNRGTYELLTSWDGSKR